MVDGPPVGEVGLEGRFHFPVLDEVLHQFGERAGFVAFLLGCEIVLSIRNDGSCQRQLRTLFKHLSRLGVVWGAAIPPLRVFVS